MKIKLEKEASAPIRVARNVFDLCSMECGYIQPYSSKVFDTGVHIEFSDDTIGLLTNNPQLHVKHKISFPSEIIEKKEVNIIIRLYNNSSVPYWVEKGTKIAQITILPSHHESVVFV